MSEGLLGWLLVTREREGLDSGSWGRLPLSSGDWETHSWKGGRVQVDGCIVG